MFWSKYKIKKVYSCKPHSNHIKVGYKGVLIACTCLHDVVVMIKNVFHDNYLRWVCSVALVTSGKEMGHHFWTSGKKRKRKS